MSFFSILIYDTKIIKYSVNTIGQLCKKNTVQITCLIITTSMAIFSRDKMIIFIHIPKNAGSSINHLLHNSLNFEPIGKKHDNLQMFPQIKFKHAFCVVRNPFDRLASHYWYHYRVFDVKMGKKWKLEYGEKNRKIWQFLCKGFEHYVKSNEFEDVFHSDNPKWFDTRWEPQSSWADGCDIILRYENLKHDWIQIQQLLQTSFILPKINQSPNNDYRKMYSDDLKKYCANKFEKDLNQFNYSF